MAVSFTSTTVSNPTGVQGTYSRTLTAGHEGMIADLQSYVVRTGYNESGAVVAFGSVVVLNTSGTQLSVKKISGATDTIMGIATDTHVFENSAGSIYTLASKDANNLIGYPDKQPINVLSKGVIWVYVNEAVPELNSDVRIRHTTASSKYAGRFDVSADAGKTVKVTAGARWLSTTSGAGLALLEIDIPSITVTADAA
jgi:hypothetical protein